ncbi:hypothetical protein [Candidatus Poriferisodalis sp.]|uniref:hypothetical protein n=1 Tax=Candidatus Poriferisodalis sp. TaxID=3101277 RepID=UPI003C6F3EDE
MQDQTETVYLTPWRLDRIAAPEIAQRIPDMHESGMLTGLANEDIATAVDRVLVQRLRRDIANVRACA